MVVVTMPEGAFLTSGNISIEQQSFNTIFVTQPLVITGASGGMALGSSLTTSGYKINSVTVENPSPTIHISGSIIECLYIGGCSGNAPYPGSGNIASGKGFVLCPGIVREYHIPRLDAVYIAAETSGNIISYDVELTVI
jgi:hypothetical protein